MRLVAKEQDYKLFFDCPPEIYIDPKGINVKTRWSKQKIVCNFTVLRQAAFR
jgi:hypothetical protein